jgi:hypothetical protein
MDVLGEVGGLLSSLQAIFGLFFNVYAYRLHHATLVRESNQQLNFPHFFGLRCWLYETLQNLKGFCSREADGHDTVLKLNKEVGKIDITIS